jgi:GrpB-like predicted nucleotidyltransferase (UPF0157 family)
VVTAAPGDGKMAEMVRAARLIRELEASCRDPREPIARKIRRFQTVRSPELPPRVRALRSNDPAWSALFAAEAARIRGLLGEAVARVEHFGSTAIPASILSSKNAIDFLVAVRGSAAARRAGAAFAALGYTAYGVGPCDPETEWWWRIDGAEVAFAAHLCDAANPWVATVVNFRDYLRAHPAECVRYEEVKRQLAAEPGRSLFEYSIGKLRLFYDISKKADAWQAGAGGDIGVVGAAASGQEDESFPEVVMTTAAPSSARARTLVSFWNESRLRAATAKSASVKPAPGTVRWRSALEDVLRVGYGLQAQSRFVGGAWERVRWRTTPSAGALYPFEVIASVVGEESYLWDIERGCLVSCGPALGRQDLAEAGLVTLPGSRLEALLIFVGRPWMSMKKYRQRGYAYCHLDVGHTATNVGVYTIALGHTPTLHLRFSRSVLAERLALEGLCREPMAVLSFAGAGALPAAGNGAGAAVAAGAAAAPAGGGAAAAAYPRLAGVDLPDPQEILNWESLHGILSFGSPLAPPGAPAGTTLLVEPEEAAERPLLPLPDGRPALSAAAEWHSAIVGRRSAKGFRPEPLSLEQIGELLSALRGASLPSDCSLDGSGRLGVRVVARNVGGLAGIYAYTPRHHALRRLGGEAGDPRPACMQQEIARDAAALLIFHAPLCRLIDGQGYSAFAELLFHAAQLGQRLHLAAARLAVVGITCIGGFDGEECAALAHLDAGEEAIYVVLLGIPDGAAYKEDRLSVAFSHGYSSGEE